jgi:hypothetical protein
MSFKLNLSRDATFTNTNPNVRPQPLTPAKRKHDWVAFGLCIALGLLIGSGLALATLASMAPVMP